MTQVLPSYVVQLLSFMAVLFIVAVGSCVLSLLALYVVDVTQTRHAVRRNFPVIGRMRYVFEHLGEFFRQYFFAMDREELPFNRAQRSYVYRAAKNIDSTLAFGSTKDLTPVGTVLFLNTAFPTLEEDVVEARELTIGPYSARPYTTGALFVVSGMSFGAISAPAITALSRGVARAGSWMNTGEGGLSPYHLLGGCDLVFQIGTAKYGVRDAHGRLSHERLASIAAHEQVRMFEIKLSQGAKPGKGGILPGAKVTEEIARVRGIPRGHDSISPNGHPELRSVADILDMIAEVREVTGKPTGLKAVIGRSDWLRDLFTEVRRRGPESAPDFITVDSADGGTGAAPMSLMDHVGLPLKESLPLVVDLLREHDLRERVRVIASGKLITAANAAWALCAGADFVASARGPMFALGCIQAMQCNKNTCPTGITTHNPRLQVGLDPHDKAERVANYIINHTREIGVIAHSCGVSEPRSLRREHVHVVTADGRSVPLDQLHPYAETGAALNRPAVEAAARLEA